MFFTNITMLKLILRLRLVEDALYEYIVENDISKLVLPTSKYLLVKIRTPTANSCLNGKSASKTRTTEGDFTVKSTTNELLTHTVKDFYRAQIN